MAVLAGQLLSQVYGRTNVMKIERAELQLHYPKEKKLIKANLIW